MTTGWHWLVVERVPAGPCRAVEVVRENHGSDHCTPYYRARKLGPRFDRTVVLASENLQPGMVLP